MMNRWWLTMKRRKSRRNFRKSSRKRPKSTTLDVAVDKISALPDPILGAVDRISALPDPILGIILSFLPVTKEAIATSILSKRWRFMWKTVHNLALFHWGSKEGDDMKFVEFVNRVLYLHDPRLLKKFMLFWKPRCNLVHLRSWIETAITRNVHKLALDVETRVGPDNSPEPIEMPISVFSCESLKHLVLDGGIYFSEADVIFLPRLERLELINVDFESEDVFQNFVSGCPVLNFLHLHVDIFYWIDYFGRGDMDVDDSFTYMIFSNSLKRLEASFCHKTDGPGEDIFFFSLMLETPSLEVLALEGFIYEIKILNSLSCLVEAFFGISDLDLVDYDIFDSLIEVVRACDSAKFLDLSNDATWALSQVEVSLSTEFKKLVKLEIGASCCHCCVPLRDFLQYSDNLEVLIINQVPRGDFHVHHTDWNAPEEVPRCLLNSLKKVVFDVYCGNADECEVIRYMLKHGSVLEAIQIKCERETAKFELVQEICKFPRQSRVCEVEFIIDESIPYRAERRPYIRSDWDRNLQTWLICNASGGECK